MDIHKWTGKYTNIHLSDIYDYVKYVCVDVFLCLSMCLAYLSYNKVKIFLDIKQE